MRIAITQFVSLDGVSQGPGSADEDRSDGFVRGGWFVPYLDEEFVRHASNWLDFADGLLLGRRTYEAFARDWPQITDPDDPFTERMNALPKYVVSGTLTTGGWNPTIVLGSEADASVAELREQPGGELQIHGSSRLASSLLAMGLVDIVRLAVAPVVVGQGRRLFSHTDAGVGFRLVRNDVTPSGLALLEYETMGTAVFGEYAGSPSLAEGS